MAAASSGDDDGNLPVTEVAAMLNLHCIQPLRQLLSALGADGESPPARTLPVRTPPARKPPVRTPPTPAAAEAEAGTDPAADDDAIPGCGWFESSHALQHGLSVREHASADTLGRELPLANWLELHLAGWHAALPA